METRSSKKKSTVENELREAKQEQKHNENVRAATSSRLQDVERQADENSVQIQQTNAAADDADANNGPEARQHITEQIKEQLEDHVTRLDTLSASIQNGSIGQAAFASGGYIDVGQDPSDIANHPDNANDNSDDEPVIPYPVMSSSEQDQQRLDEQTSKQEAAIEDLEKTLHLQDARLYDQEMRMSFDVSYDGTYIWKIDELSRKRQEAITGKTPFVTSSSFYVGHYGYKVCARVYPNGEGIGTDSHLSLFFVIMKGDYDAHLLWPFRQTVTFKLLDLQDSQNNITDYLRPDPNSSSFKRPTTSMNIASGFPLFVSHDDLGKESSFIKDDTLYIKIIVDTSGLPPLGFQ